MSNEIHYSKYNLPSSNYKWLANRGTNKTIWGIGKTKKEAKCDLEETEVWLRIVSKRIPTLKLTPDEDRPY